MIARSSKHRAQWDGFTLIEFLVVIAIIGILAGLLLPVMADVKEKAKRTVCLSDARQLGMSVMLYAEEHEDALPPSTDYSAPTTLPERIWTMKVLPYVQSTAVFSCPSARNSAFPSNWTERGIGSIGYTTATAYDPQVAKGFPTLIRASAIESPSMAPLFGDTTSGPTSGRYRGYVFDPYNGQASSSDSCLGTRDILSAS